MKPIHQQKTPLAKTRTAEKIIPEKRYLTAIQLAGVGFIVLLLSIQTITQQLGHRQPTNADETASKKTFPAQQNETRILSTIRDSIALPDNELPTIATVADPQSLKKLPFLANAHKGDLVIIFSGNRRVILYDPSTNKIKDMATLTGNISTP